MPRTRRAPKQSQPHTAAWQTLEENLESVMHLVSLGGAEMRQVVADVTRAGKRVHESLVKSEDKKLGKPLIRSLERTLKKITTRIDRYQTTELWQVVILVTCVETYLQDLLAAAAAIATELMKDPEKQRATYADVIAADSLDALATEMRMRWARRWISDGGPTQWITRLEQMGMRGHSADLGSRLELVWGIRHVMVHAAGVATSDFMRLYPGYRLAAGNRVRVSSSDFLKLLNLTREFLEATETYFVNRFPSLGASNTTP